MPLSFQLTMLIVGIFNLLAAVLIYDGWRRTIRPMLELLFADKNKIDGLNCDQNKGREI